MGRKKKINSIPTKQRLLNAAEELFGKKGFADTTYQQILKLAGEQPHDETIVRNFGNKAKETMFREVLERGLQREDLTAPRVLENDDPITVLRHSLQNTLQHLQERWGYFRMRWGFSGNPEIVHELLKRHPNSFDFWSNAVKALLEQQGGSAMGVGADEATHHLLSLLYWPCLVAPAMDSRSKGIDINQILDFWLSGLGLKEPGELKKKGIKHRVRRSKPKPLH